MYEPRGGNRSCCATRTNSLTSGFDDLLWCRSSPGLDAVAWVSSIRPLPLSTLLGIQNREAETPNLVQALGGLKLSASAYRQLWEVGLAFFSIVHLKLTSRDPPALHGYLIAKVVASLAVEGGCDPRHHL